MLALPQQVAELDALNVDAAILRKGGKRAGERVRREGRFLDLLHPAAERRVEGELRERDAGLAQNPGEKRLHFAREAAREDLESLDLSRAEVLLALDRGTFSIARELFVLLLQVRELALELTLDLELLLALLVDASRGLPRLTELEVSRRSVTSRRIPMPPRISPESSVSGE